MARTAISERVETIAVVMTTYFVTRPAERSSLATWMAWRRYLTTVRAADPKTYDIVEESAWQRLNGELAAAAQPRDANALSVPAR